MQKKDLRIYHDFFSSNGASYDWSRNDGWASVSGEVADKNKSNAPVKHVNYWATNITLSLFYLLILSQPSNKISIPPQLQSFIEATVYWYLGHILAATVALRCSNMNRQFMKLYFITLFSCNTNTINASNKKYGIQFLAKIN